MADLPEVCVGHPADIQHAMFEDGFHAVDHPDLSAIVGTVPTSFGRFQHYSVDVTIFCESGKLLFVDERGNGISLECGDALWVPANFTYACWSDEQAPAQVAVYTFGPVSNLFALEMKGKCTGKTEGFYSASSIANTVFYGCLVASATDPLRRDPFFANNQLVLFDSDGGLNAGALGERKLKAGILFWGKDAQGTPEQAMIHRHGPNKPVTELIRIVCGDMQAWHQGNWAKQSLITIAGWVWHSWRWMTGCETPLAEHWQKRFGAACQNKFAIMFFIYAEGGKESKGDTTDAPKE